MTIYDTLMARSQDEVATEYGLLRRRRDTSRRLQLRSIAPQGGALARRPPGHPGGCHLPIEALKAQSPLYSSATGTRSKPRRAASARSFTFDVPGNRELPHIAGGSPVLPKHY
jgi:microcin C transport system substrate-binding protein